jgi:uncharacterized membrane protein YdfJ with MMPL/SSD domain
MPDDFYKKNMEMWEQFTSTYMDTMFKTVQKTMDQSATFKDQLDKTVDAAVSNQMKLMLDSLEAMRRQIDTLSQKMDEFMAQNKD